MVKLICYICGICSAWCWRYAVVYLIYWIFGYYSYDASYNWKTVATYLFFLAFLQISVTYAHVKLRLHYAEQGKYFHFSEIGTKSIRKNKKFLVFAVMYRNLDTIVGLQWYDAILTITTMIGNHEGYTLMLVVLWLLVTFTVILTTIIEFYWKKYWFGFQISQRSLLNDYYHESEIVQSYHLLNVNFEMSHDDSNSSHNNNNNNNNSNTTNTHSTQNNANYGSINRETNNIETNGEIEKKERFWYIFWKEFLDLLFYAMAIGGLVSFGYAVSLVVLINLYCVLF